MVDLVKIRRKQKREREDARGEPPADSGQEAPAETPAVGPPSDGGVQAVAADVTPEVEAGTRGQDARGPSEDAVAAEPAQTAEPAQAQPATTDKLRRFLERAGRATQEQTSSLDEHADEEDSQFQLLTFAIGEETYALRIDSIVEIITPRTPTRVPNSGTLIEGVISLRGTIVTLMDIRNRLGRGTAGVAAGADPRIVVIELEGETLGFVVDRVFRVVKVDPGEIEAQPVSHVSEQREHIVGVFQRGSSLIILLDPVSLVRGETNGTGGGRMWTDSK